MRAPAIVYSLMFLSAASSAAPGLAWAQQASASGSVGAGVFGTEGIGVVDIGVDVHGERYALGLGGRVHWVGVDGIRRQDWDERSEWANIVRYLWYRDERGAVDVSMAVGQLGGVSLGGGAVIDQYSTGLNLDHHHLGVEVNVRGEKLAIHAIIDDLIATRVVGAHGEYRAASATRTLSVGLSAAGDVRAPVSEGQPDALVVADTVLPMAAIHGRAQVHTRDRRFAGAVYVDAVAISTMAVGGHIGLAGDMSIGEDTAVSLRGELRLGSDKYIPGWAGPLYEINRQAQRPRGDSPDGSIQPDASQLDVAREGGLGGLGGMVETRVHMPDTGDIALSYARRVGLPDLLVARLSMPHFRQVQGAAWAAAELGDGAEAWILATEVRVQINRRLFGALELSRLYIDDASTLAPRWTILATFGATLAL